MIHNYFTDNDLSITLIYNDSSHFLMEISSDFSGSNRKSQLHVNEKLIADDLKRFKRSLKTKNLVSIRLDFDGIDHYDDMTDMYDTPMFLLKKGFTNPTIRHRTFGYIPKDWEISMQFLVKKTSTNTTIMEIASNALGVLLKAEEKKFKKAIKPILQGKENRVTVYLHNDE